VAVVFAGDDAYAVANRRCQRMADSSHLRDKNGRCVTTVGRGS
jgi:hypothetical protein